MTLPTSGQISLFNLAQEYDHPGKGADGTDVPLSHFYAGGDYVQSGAEDKDGNPIPSSGAIALGDFYGASAINYKPTTQWSRTLNSTAQYNELGTKPLAQTQFYRDGTFVQNRWVHQSGNTNVFEEVARGRWLEEGANPDDYIFTVAITATGTTPPDSNMYYTNFTGGIVAQGADADGTYRFTDHANCHRLSFNVVANRPDWSQTMQLEFRIRHKDGKGETTAYIAHVVQDNI